MVCIRMILLLAAAATTTHGLSTCKNGDRVTNYSTGPLSLCNCLPPLGIGHYASTPDQICLKVCRVGQKPIRSDRSQVCACPSGQGVYNGSCVTPPPSDPACQQNKYPAPGTCPDCGPASVYSWSTSIYTGPIAYLCKCAGETASVTSYGTYFNYCNMPLCLDKQTYTSPTSTLSCKCARDDPSWKPVSGYKCAHLSTCAENATVYSLTQDPLCFCGDDAAADIHRSVSNSGQCVTFKNCVDGQTVFDGTSSSDLCFCDTLGTPPLQKLVHNGGTTTCATFKPCTMGETVFDASNYSAMCYCDTTGSPPTKTIFNSGNKSTCENLPKCTDQQVLHNDYNALYCFCDQFSNPPTQTARSDPVTGVTECVTFNKCTNGQTLFDAITQPLCFCDPATQKQFYDNVKQLMTCVNI